MPFSKFLLERLEVPHDGSYKPSVLKNPDLEPITPMRRSWGFWSFFGYWAVPNITIWTWSTGSSILALGMNIQQSMVAITIANIAIVIYTCLNSYIGAKYHIGYTVCQRVIFGIYGSGIGVVLRMLLSIVFYGAQSWLGGLSLVVTFSSLSKNYLNLQNTFPEAVAMSTRDFIGFFVFQLIQFIFYFFKPEKMDKIVNISCLFCAVSFIGIFATCLAKNNGPGHFFYKNGDIEKLRIGWMWLYSMSIWYGALSPDVTNSSDFSRFACSTKRLNWAIISSIFITGTTVPLFGLICASATEDLYGEKLWLPTDIVLAWLNEDYSRGLRAASFFLGIAFASSQLSFNILANGFAGGMDLSGVAPKYINIKRGAIITALLSWVVQPWRFFNTSSIFLDIMSSFGVIVTPIIAILIADFFIVRKKVLNIQELFSTSPEGTYYFTKGFNLRAILTWVASIAPGIPGLIASTKTVKVPNGLNNYYYGNLFIAFCCPLLLYVIICKLFPPKNIGIENDESYCEALDKSERNGIPSITGESVRNADYEKRLNFLKNAVLNVIHEV